MYRTYLTARSAERLVKKYATGKTFRNLQMWCTSYECEVNGELFVVVIPDIRLGCYKYNGSDL